MGELKSEELTLDQAISIIKKAVKYSHLENQKHIDPTLIIAEKQGEFFMAMAFIRTAVNNGKLTDKELKLRLGLN
jgi:hypothetical protein